MASTALSSGDSAFVDADYDGAVEQYTAAICLTDDRRKKDASADTSAANDATQTRGGRGE